MSFDKRKESITLRKAEFLRRGQSPTTERTLLLRNSPSSSPSGSKRRSDLKEVNELTDVTEESDDVDGNRSYEQYHDDFDEYYDHPPSSPPPAVLDSHPVIVEINKEKSMKFQPDIKKVPTKGIMRNKKDKQKSLETTPKSVRWADEQPPSGPYPIGSATPFQPTPLVTEHSVPYWNRKSPFLNNFWKSVVAKENLKRQKVCVWIIIFIIAALCMGFVVVVLFVVKFTRSPAPPPIPSPQPHPLDYSTAISLGNNTGLHSTPG